MAVIDLLRHVLRRLDEASSWCRLIGHTPCWADDTVSCKQCGIPLDRGERPAAMTCLTNYRSRYGYPLRIALAAEFWWRLEHLPYRGGEGGFCGHLARYAYGRRKAWEKRGARDHR